MSKRIRSVPVGLKPFAPDGWRPPGYYWRPTWSHNEYFYLEGQDTGLAVTRDFSVLCWSLRLSLARRICLKAFILVYDENLTTLQRFLNLFVSRKSKLTRNNWGGIVERLSKQKWSLKEKHGSASWTSFSPWSDFQLGLEISGVFLTCVIRMEEVGECFVVDVK